MSFLKTADHFQAFDFQGYFDGVSVDDAARSLDKAGDMNALDTYDLLNLLSPAAQELLEPMAQKAHALTLQYFGRTISLYAPIYISDYCTNACTYCGFHSGTGFKRTQLTLEEVDIEARAIHETGLRHVLMLTGEAPAKTPMEYLEGAVAVLAKYFASVGLEIYPMEIPEYQRLKAAGADALTIYQETYNQDLYRQVHPTGPKSDYAYRLDTPERGARAGFRGVNLGPLFGLGEDPRIEAFMAGLHARYIEKKYPDVEVGLSLPRMRHAQGAIAPKFMLSDKGFVQTILAWRLFMPRLGISISTRESSQFRDQILPLGVTRYSAGCKTDVGGYRVRSGQTTPQFDITDHRSVQEVVAMLNQKGYQPVFKDWEIF